MTSRFFRLAAPAAAIFISVSVAGCNDPPPLATVRHEENRASLAVRAVSPLVGLTPPKPGEAFFDGEVTQRLDVGPYAYLSVVDGERSWWAVTLGLDAPLVGDRVHVKSFGVKEQFFSKGLGRTFDRLHFATAKPLNQLAMTGER